MTRELPVGHDPAGQAQVPTVGSGGEILERRRNRLRHPKKAGFAVGM